MASSSAVPHDPMYNFEPHFPDRLSRLHLQGELHSPSGSFRRKKGRAVRSGARYKTQPVTFDEIKEVDEEPSGGGGGGAGENAGKDKRSSGGESQLIGQAAAMNLFGQLQAFSRSMDGLLPKSAHARGEDDHFPTAHHHISHSRSGSRKFQRHPECIPERAEAEQQQQQQKETKQKKLSNEGDSTPQSRLKPSPLTIESSNISAAVSDTLTPPSADGGSVSPSLSPNMAPRRQKITAKAKKRQKAAASEGEQ